MKKVIALFAILCCSFLAIGQKKKITQSIVWSNLTINTKLDSLVFGKLNLQHRAFVDKNNTYQFIANVLVTRKFDNLSVGAGFIFFDFHRELMEDEGSVPVLELRPYQNIRLTNQYGSRLSIANRFTVEERFQQKVQNGEVSNSYRYSWRFRFLWSAKYKLWSKDKDHKFDLSLSEEVFLNHGEHIVYNTFDQNRLSLKGILTLAHTSWYAGYCHWTFHPSSGEVYDQRKSLIFGLTVKSYR